MKFIFKNILSANSDETKYKSTILSFIISMLCIVVLIAISNFIPIVLLSRFFMVLLTTFSFYLIFTFFCKIICISDNIEKKKVKEKKYKLKFDPIVISFDDFSIWLNCYPAPEQLIVRLKEEYHYIEISYDTKGRRGDYINRKTYFDNKATKVDDIEKIIKEKSQSGKIEVLETFDHNKPQLIIDEINEIKKINFME